MNESYIIDDKDRRLLTMLQEGIPLTARPYKEMAGMLKMSEDELILRLKRFKETGLVKRIDFRLDLKKIGFLNTLVACRIPKTKIPKAREVILNCKNVTHNYLRRNELNMWFTLSILSTQELRNLLARLREKLKAEKMLSFPTRKSFKLEFGLKC